MAREFPLFNNSGVNDIFDPVTRGIVIFVAGVLAATPLVFLAMQAAGKLSEKLCKHVVPFGCEAAELATQWIVTAA